MDVLDYLRDISDKLQLILDQLSGKCTTVTFFAWLVDWFQLKAPSLKDNGYDLKHSIDKHVYPNIQDKPLSEYTAHDITKALSAVSSPRMRQIVRQIYNQAFREAVRAGLIDRNPVDDVDCVKHNYNSGHALTLAQQSEFLELTVNDVDSALYRFYLLTGCRPSEPLAVCWSDVSDHSIRIPGTKTVKSDRVLPLSDELKQLLSSVFRSSDRIFPRSYQAVQKHFTFFIQPKLSFSMTLKDLRHTFATRCIEAGISIKTIQKWLGHSNYGTTANIYSHVTSEFELAELNKLNKVRF